MSSVKMEHGSEWDKMKAELEQLRRENKILRLEHELSVTQHELGQSASMQATPVTVSESTRRVLFDIQKGRSDTSSVDAGKQSPMSTSKDDDH